MLHYADPTVRPLLDSYNALIDAALALPSCPERERLLTAARKADDDAWAEMARLEDAEWTAYQASMGRVAS